MDCCRKINQSGVPPRPLAPKGPSRETIAKAIRMFTERAEREEQWVERYGHARKPISMTMGDGKVMVAIGSSIYKQVREGRYTFLDAVHDHALDFFGVSMLEAEEARPLEARHPALQWMYTTFNFLNELHAKGGAPPGGDQIGAGAAWYRFAYDLYTIRDNARLERVLKRRLMDPETFQGARHELWVAALCIAAGFAIEFEDESDNSRTHPEFIAKDRFSDACIAVEAKSRRRKGIYGFAGGKDSPAGESVGIRQLVLDAYKKETGLPLYVFVDVNLPPASTEDWNRWMGELDGTMIDLEVEGYASPSPANAVFFKNDPSHFLATEKIGGDWDRLWMKHYEASAPRVAHPSADIVERFGKAYAQRVAPPLDFPEG